MIRVTITVSSTTMGDVEATREADEVHGLDVNKRVLAGLIYNTGDMISNAYKLEG